MTKEELLKYRNIWDEIVLLKDKIKYLEPEFTQDSVIGSEPEFPFTQHNLKIRGYDIDTYEKKVHRLKNKLNKKLDELIQEKDRIMSFIYSVDDSRMRQILIYRYIDGLSWKAIGNKMGYGTSTIRLIHYNFIKRLAPISTF